jgi:predicted CopG family antitoxin
VVHELTITVDDAVYQTLKPLVEQQTIGSLLYEFIQNRTKQRSAPSIAALRGTLHKIDTTDIRDETDRLL